MKRKISFCIVVLVCLALQASTVATAENVSSMATAENVMDTMGSSGDWLSPNVGRVPVGADYDPGLAGMIQWLHQPVPRYAYYTTTDGFFYSETVPDSTFTTYTEYYVTTGAPVVGIVSDPIEFDIIERTPAVVYFGAGVGLPYAQYASMVPSETNDLWIQGATNWTQYVASPVGAWLQLIAYAPAGGPAGFYEMVQTGAISSNYRTLQLNAGYNTMNFNADQAGRHMMYFVVDNQPSNLIIVDVFAQDQIESAPPVQSEGSAPPATISY